MRNSEGRLVSSGFGRMRAREPNILSAFRAENVEFLPVGAYALAAHGLPRTTGIGTSGSMPAPGAARGPGPSAVVHLAAPESGARPGSCSFARFGLGPRRVVNSPAEAGIRFPRTGRRPSPSTGDREGPGSPVSRPARGRRLAGGEAIPGPPRERARAARVVHGAPRWPGRVETSIAALSAEAPRRRLQMYIDLAVLFAGWALGLLSTPITDAMRRWPVKKRITRAVRAELHMLQDAFALVVVQVARHRGALSRPLLEALMSTLRTSGHVVGAGKALKAIDDLLHADESIPTTLQPPEPRGSHTLLSLKVQGVPYLESHLHRMDFYSHDVQRQLLEIRAGSLIFNQHAEESVRYHFITFNECIDEEHLAALIANVEKCYERAAEKASELVSQVAVLLQSPEMQAT